MIRPEPLRKRPERPLKKKVEKKEEEKKEGEVKEGEEKKEEKKEEEPAEPELEESDYPTINERLAINNTRRGTSSVVIRDSLRADHGVYMVKVENDHGIASATCEVNVLGEYPPLFCSSVTQTSHTCPAPEVQLCDILKPDVMSLSSDTPGPPVNFRFEEVRKNSVICKWDPPVDDGGSEILNYTLEKKDNSKLEFGWSSVTSTLRGCRYLVPKLIEKKEYIFRVTAENKFGSGPPCISKPLVAKNPFGTTAHDVTCLTPDVLCVHIQCSCFTPFLSCPQNLLRLLRSHRLKTSQPTAWWSPGMNQMTTAAPSWDTGWSVVRSTVHTGHASTGEETLPKIL